MGPSAHQAGDRPRRFYAAVEVTADPGGFTLALDARTAKTPGGRSLTLPTHALTTLLAEEWATQADRIDFSSMPATRLAFTVLDRTEGAAEAMAAEVARYAASDVVCYFADSPEVLAARQAAGWGPMLDWAREELGVALRIVTGTMPAPQPIEALARVRKIVAQTEPFRRAAIALATPLFGSAVLALALAAGRLDGDDAFDLSRLEEAYQQERWGADAEADARTALLREESRRIACWFAALAA